MSENRLVNTDTEFLLLFVRQKTEMSQRKKTSSKRNFKNVKATSEIYKATWRRARKWSGHTWKGKELFAGSLSHYNAALLIPDTHRHEQGEAYWLNRTDHSRL